MITATYQVENLTCAHCVTHVTTALTGLPGAQDVTVDLVPGGRSTVTVTAAAPLPTADVAAALTEAGYHLVPA